jgi:protein arginine N-methyltransferase 1
VDLAKATPADLEFCREFEITFTKQQHCHAVVLHFSVDFSASHAPVRIDTSPEEAATHWKHTVLYLDKSLAVHAGEKLTGAIRLTRHAANHRHLSIVVSYAFNGKIGGAQAWSQLYNVQ